MLNNKKNYGQFFTKNSEYIIGNLIKYIPHNKILVEPFCGEGDLIVSNNVWEKYDIEPKTTDTIKQDTLINPPDYKDKFIITNPPFLYRNKSVDKKIYDIYGVSDLYKAALLTFFDSDGGIIILPLNFLCDEDNKLRNKFFNLFNIGYLNIFEETVFDDTSYTICSFYFYKKINKNSENNFNVMFFPKKEEKNITLTEESGWRLGGEFYDFLNNQKNIGISRLVKNKTPNSNLYLRAIDTGTMEGRISLSICDEYVYGKESDRTFATIILDKYYTLEEQKLICNYFNDILETYRSKYNSLFLTNYRNSTSSYSRKRISFDIAYKLISFIIENKIKKVG